MKKKYLKDSLTYTEQRFLTIVSLFIFTLFCTPISGDISPKSVSVSHTAAYYEAVEKQTVTETVSTPEVEQIEQVVSEPVVSEVSKPVVSEPKTDVSTKPQLTNEEIDLIALVTMAEAEGEIEEGKRWVIDVILNRLDSPGFPNTVRGVIYAKGAFSGTAKKRIQKCHVRDDIRQLVLEELESRRNSKVYYFRTKHYHKFGTPVKRVGNHYFSTN